MFVHTVTIYNKYREDNVEKWARTVLHGVFWNSSQGATTRKTGVSKADGVMVVIPRKIEQAKKYLSPKQWAANRAGRWTLQPQDKIVKGEIAYEIVKSASELEKQFDDVMTIQHVDDRDFGGNMAHWEVSGV